MTAAAKGSSSMPAFVERFGLTGKVALVTGASKGIGVAICDVLADAGADIVAVARDPGGLAEIKAGVEAKGRRCLAVEADLASVEATRNAARQALEHFGAVHILVNNAGIARNAPLVDATVEDWDLTQAVNLRAPFVMGQALAPQMIDRKAGKIINISSQTSSIVALVDHGAYASSKGGLNALTKVMCAEWAQHNIQCNAVNPTVVLTPMGEKVWGRPEMGGPMLAKIPAGRFASTMEVADVVLFLASSASDMINGETILVDGGFTAM
jgi:NAD(P)-dependent dehydrogenase (short-subunit alcohol dehydrogenase family)